MNTSYEGTAGTAQRSDGAQYSCGMAYRVILRYPAHSRLDHVFAIQSVHVYNSVQKSNAFSAFSPSLLRYYATVDHQGHAATEVARSACQENHRSSEIFWQTPPACWCSVNNVLGVFCILRVDFCHCCFDVSGRRISDKRAARYRSLDATLASERMCVSQWRVSTVKQRSRENVWQTGF